MTEKLSSLARLRAEVDSIDLQILSLLLKRLKIAKQMGHVKKSEGRALRDTAREKEVLERLELENAKADVSFSNHDLSLLYKQIMNICLKVQNDQ